LQIELENSNVHYNLAVNLEQVGRVEEAVRHYRQSLRIKPNHQLARQRLQEILAERQKPDDGGRKSEDEGLQLIIVPAFAGMTILFTIDYLWLKLPRCALAVLAPVA
jgi:tetratricopeptide (TPR) repeat protein